MSGMPAATAPLPRRDLWLLPLISFLTAASMACFSEFVARWIWPEALRLTCIGPDGQRNRKCTAYAKNAEGPLIAYRFNDCGYRTMESCGPKPPGTLRVVVMGTSLALGWGVPYDDTFSARAARGLSAALGRPVEFQNLGSMGFPLTSAADFVPKALALQADAIMLVVSPWDLGRFDPGFHIDVNGDNIRPAEPTPAGSVNPRVHAAAQAIWLAAKRSRALLIMQHYLVQDENTLISLFQGYGSPDDVVYQRWSANTVRRFAAFESTLDRIADKLRGTNVPFLLMLVPSRIQAALISGGVQLRGVDAYGLFRRMSQAAVSHGFEFVDLSPEFRRTPHAADSYYPVDSHPAARINEIAARALIRRLTAGLLPAFAKLSGETAN